MCTWPIHRDVGAPYRLRPMDIWEAQQRGDKDLSSISRKDRCWEQLVPLVHTLDLVVFGMHDSYGFTTPLLRQLSWQYLAKTSIRRISLGVLIASTVGINEQRAAFCRLK